MVLTRRRTALVIASSLAALAGCPLYPDDRGHRVCVGSECFDCPDPYFTSACVDWICNTNLDCPTATYCGANGRCVFPDGSAVAAGGVCVAPDDCGPGANCGSDNRCHVGDCSTSGCPTSFVCKVSAGAARCELVGDGGGPAAPECRNDQSCSPSGTRCLSGTCVAPVDQCTDSTQCRGSSACVDGACTPRCGGGAACPTGYSCDDARSVCTKNPRPCSTSAECGDGRVCSQERCVAPCSAGERCADGLVCVEGGCVVEQRPVFICGADGPSTSCADGSICLHHSCYIGCDGDAGSEACKASDVFNECKAIATPSGTFSVCGSTTNLGNECDPSLQKECASGRVCIDGFCK